jgi:hypothetical protein
MRRFHILSGFIIVAFILSHLSNQYQTDVFKKEKILKVHEICFLSVELA